MSLQLAVALLLLLAAGLGLAEAARLPPGPRRLAGRAAAIASPVLLYMFLFPPLQNVSGVALRLLTAGATPAQLAAAGGGMRTVALPGAAAPAAVERVPDLGTALRRYPDSAALYVVGGGLGAADRDAAAGWPLSFAPAPPPRGVAELQLPGDIRVGHRFVVRGRINQAEGVQISLIEPGGRRHGPLAPGADGRFQFELTAPRAAQIDYQLQLLEADGRTLQQLALPLQIRAGNPLRLLLSGGPDADLKYLQRWALDAGHTVDARTSLSRGLAQQRGDASLGAAALGATDVAIVDDRAWSQLDKPTRARLLEASAQGLGLLLRLRAAPSAALAAEWRELGIDFHSAAIDTKAAVRGEIRDGATAQLQRLPLQPRAGDDLIALAETGDGQAVAVARNRGRGRLGAWWLLDSHTLVLSGQAALHDALWAQALDALARPRQPAPAQVPALAWQNERATLCAREPGLGVAAPDAAATALSTRSSGDEHWCGGYWPRQPGWHTLQVGDARRPFYVRGIDDAPTLHAATTAAATQALVGRGGDRAAAAAVAGPRWPWFLAWLLLASLLWWLSRTRPATAG